MIRRPLPVSWDWRSSARWSRCEGCAVARRIGPTSSATPSTGSCSGWPEWASARRAGLADHTDLTPATVAQMLEHLEATGLVTRTRSDEDRRVVLSTLTERGAEVVAERQAQMEPRWRAAVAEFSDDELDAAARVLNRLADYFDALLDDNASGD